MPIQAEQDKQLVEIQEREWLHKGPEGQVVYLGPDEQMLPHQGDSSVWSMTQNKLTNPRCLIFRDWQWRVEYKNKNQPMEAKVPERESICGHNTKGKARMTVLDKEILKSSFFHAFLFKRHSYFLEKSEVTRYFKNVYE